MKSLELNTLTPVCAIGISNSLSNDFVVITISSTVFLTGSFLPLYKKNIYMYIYEKNNFTV